MAKPNDNRIRWIDIAKAMVMVLVVFGHTMRGGAGQRMVYSFHVAAFYFLAGMTAKTDHVGKRILADIRRILVPYFAFGLISIAIYAVLGKFAAGKFGMEVDTSIWSNLRDLLYANARGRSLQFNTPLWFLPCLFAVKLVYYGVDRLCGGKQWAILLTSLALAAISFGYLALGLPYPPSP
jgi:fucose 4-O-acetylase-like acetyltransferase